MGWGCVWMYIRPIPLSALCDEIIIGTTTYKNVMVENHTKQESSPYGDIQVSNYLLIADRVNTPDYETLKTLLKNGKIVKFGGLSHTVTQNEILKDRLNSIEHHLEVYLT